MFLLDDKVSEVFLLRELVPEANAIVIDTETHDDITVQILLEEGHRHLIIVIAYAALLAPHGLPGLVKRRVTGRHHREPVEQRILIHDLLVVKVIELTISLDTDEFQPQAALLNHLLAHEHDIIDRNTALLNIKINTEIAIG